MMKVALISDLHLGVKKASDAFQLSQDKFYTEQMIPYLYENKITDVFFLGDIFDNRNHTSTKTLDFALKLFGEKFADFNLHMLVGNHDIYYKTSVEVNTLRILKNLKNVTIYEQAQMISVGSKSVYIVPWIVNEEEFVNKVTNDVTEADYCFGHFELSGFNLNKYMTCEHGMKSDLLFANFGKTFSGHFHKRTNKTFNGSTIQYLGSPYQLTRADKDEDRGFCVLDIDSGEYDFVNNEKSIKFITVNYPDKVTKDLVLGNIVDVHIKYDPTQRESDVQRYMKIVESFNPIAPPSIKIEREEFDEEGNVIELKSMGEMLREYVENLTIDKKEVILSELLNLYKQFT